MKNRGRIFFISIVFTLLFLTALGRLFYLQVVRAGYYQGVAKKQQNFKDVVLPERGGIYLSARDPKGAGGAPVPLALTKSWYNVWVSPQEISPDAKEEVIKNLSQLLGVEEKTVRSRIEKAGDPYEPIKDKADKKEILELRELAFKGVHWEAFQDRYYPLGDFASQVVGFTAASNAASLAASENAGKKIKAGQYGLESYFNSELKGETGYISGVKKALGSLVFPLSSVVKAKKGDDIYLTIDYNIQLTLERELKKAAEKWGAEGVSGIVLDPQNGAVLAMSAWPGFDPNFFNKVKDSSAFLNPNLQLVFEPGSIFKPITMAAALDINVISPDLKYYDAGEVSVDGFTIRNSTRQSWGEQTMTNVLEKSLNTGVIFALRRMPQGVWREYINNFGFGEKTGIALPGEAKGDISNLKSGVEIDWLTSSFGQGISVTPLAMVSAIGAIANGGEVLKPYIVDKIVPASANPALEKDKFNLASDNLSQGRGRTVKRRAIKETTSRTLTQMLTSVVENGSGRRAKIPGYSVAGKTGTAQVASPSGGYIDKTIHTFVGYAPTSHPAFVMLIKLDNPRGVEFSEATAAPVFKTVGEYILHYLNVPPDKPLVK